MTANTMIKLLDLLSESAKEKQIVFCHNPSNDICDDYVSQLVTQLITCLFSTKVNKIDEDN